MNRISELDDRLTHAGDLASGLAAAYDAFEGIRAAIRGREDPASGLFAALVMSAASAVDGRDAVTRAPSLPVSALRQVGANVQASGAEPEIGLLADQLAQLAYHLHIWLARAEQEATQPGDRQACVEAAACAREIRGMLAGAPDD